MDNPFVSVIIPCRNEASFVRGLINDLKAQDYPKSQWEVLLIDGQSDDGTTSIIREYLAEYSWLKLIENPDRIPPYALNMGIRRSKGEIIVRMDVHASYPPDYVSSLVKNIIELNADNVGGVWITEPGANTLMAKAIAIASSHKFGIGNADYRAGTKEIRQVDTVPFGCYRKSIFESIGLFDVTMLKTEDDEFNARLIKNGGKIFLIPTIQIKYFARPTLGKISRMFYQYALFKPLVNMKTGHPATVRQLVPMGLILALVGSVVLALLTKYGCQVFFVVWGVYWLSVLGISLALSLKHGLNLFFNLLIVFPAIHFSYGIGYLKGIWNFVLLRKQKRGKKTDVSFNR